MSVRSRAKRTLADLDREGLASYPKEYASFKSAIELQVNGNTAWRSLNLSQDESEYHQAGPTEFLMIGRSTKQQPRCKADRLFLFINVHGEIVVSMQRFEEDGSSKYVREELRVLVTGELDIKEPWRSIIVSSSMATDFTVLQTAVQYAYCRRGLIDGVHCGNAFESLCKYWAAAVERKRKASLLTKKRKRDEDEGSADEMERLILRVEELETENALLRGNLKSLAGLMGEMELFTKLD